MSALATAAEEHREQFPLLYRASRKIEQATTPKVEWTLPVPVEEIQSLEASTVIETNFNYCQIFRSADKEALLTGIELALMHGHREVIETFHYLTTMGGVGELLGRGLRDDDHLTLWVLSDLRRIDNSLFMRPDDWVCELTLQAVPA